MHPQHRLRRAADFQRARRHGRSWSNALVVLNAAPADGGPSRWGFSVSRRVGKAVARNKVRRRLREIARRTLPSLPPGWDLVLPARPAAARAAHANLAMAVHDLLRRARLGAAV